jgi:hypothetical protein
MIYFNICLLLVLVYLIFSILFKKHFLYNTYTQLFIDIINKNLLLIIFCFIFFITEISFIFLMFCK